MSIFSVDQFDELALRQGGASLPRRFEGAGTLQMRFSSRHAQTRMSQCLAGLGVTHQSGGNRIGIRTDELTALIFKLSGSLSWVEQGAVQTSFQQEGAEAGEGDPFTSYALRTFMAKVKCRWLTGILREGRLRTVFQPIVSCAAGGGVYGYEALLRCDESGREVSPADIFGVARDADLLTQLDRRACRNAVLAAARYKIPTKLFVNITPTVISNSEGCVENAVSFLGGAGLHPRQIVLEVIESEEVGDWGHFNSVLELYRAHGFEIALDDFGAGYSSLTTFNRLRPDYVKLDMELTRAVQLDPHKATLAGKLIEAAREVGVKVIAEGIESAGEYRWVKGRGVDYVQGFYICRPAAPPPPALAA